MPEPRLNSFPEMERYRFRKENGENCWTTVKAIILISIFFQRIMKVNGLNLKPLSIKLPLNQLIHISITGYYIPVMKAGQSWVLTAEVLKVLSQNRLSKIALQIRIVSTATHLITGNPMIFFFIWEAQWEEPTSIRKENSKR